MSTSRRGGFLHLGLAGSLALSGAIASSEDCALAQIIPDTTLGNQNSTVTPISPTIDQINGGATRGANLFHSFREFNVDDGRSALFTNPVGIQNILTRVTGTNPSNILGTLGVTGGNANLFLINPNGIIFGENASLNVGGSFVATTANALVFGNQGFFSASAPEVPPLLTVNPNAFLFNQIAAKPIIINSGRVVGFGYLDFPLYEEGLKVPEGKSLLFVGGDVSVNRARLSAPGGRIELGGLAGSGTVGLNVNGNDLRLSFINGVAQADIHLLKGTFIDTITTSNTEGGGIVISAHNINILKGTLESSTLGEGKAGSISLQSTGSISLENSQLNSFTLGEGKAGSISLQPTGSISVKNSTLSSLTLGEDAGSISLQSTGSISLENSTLISETRGEGKAGSISLQSTGSISVLKNSFLSSSTRAEGNAGSISLQSAGSISLENSTLASASAQSKGGNGGNIDIRAQSLSLIDGGVLYAATSKKGNAGNIQVYTIDSVTLSGVSPTFGHSSGVFTNTGRGADGQGGDITIKTATLQILNGAVLSTTTRSNFKGGNITANVNTLEIGGGGQMLTTAFGNGDAGSITVNATQSLTLSGSDPTYFDRLAQFAATATLAGEITAYPANPASGLFSNTAANSAGIGGTINIQTGQLNVRDGAEINVSSNGLGNAGNLKVEANSIFLDNQAKLQASTTSGEGGNINLQVQDLILMRHNSTISAEARNNANGGNVTIKAPFIVAVPTEDSDIIAKAVEGRGGNINITTSGMFGLEERPQLTLYSDINASSDFGVNGTIQINTPDIDPNRGLANLATEVIDASNQIAQTCPAAGKAAQNEFFITGRGGLPPDPRDVLSSDDVFVNLVTLNPGGENRSNPIVSTNQTSVTPAPLVEAQGWVINDQGQMELTAHAHSVTPHSSRQRSSDCNAPKS